MLGGSIGSSNVGTADPDTSDEKPLIGDHTPRPARLPTKVRNSYSRRAPLIVPKPVPFLRRVPRQPAIKRSALGIRLGMTERMVEENVGPIAFEDDTNWLDPFARQRIDGRPDGTGDIGTVSEQLFDLPFHGVRLEPLCKEFNGAQRSQFR